MFLSAGQYYFGHIRHIPLTSAFPFKWWKIPRPQRKRHQIDSAKSSRSTIHTPNHRFSSSLSQVWLTCMGVLDLLGSSCLQYLRASFKKSKHTLNSGRCLVGVRFWRLEDFSWASNSFLVLGRSGGSGTTKPVLYYISVAYIHIQSYTHTHTHMGNVYVSLFRNTW